MGERIENIYRKFFTDFKVATDTGILESNTKLKFATYPYVGKRYGKNKKILFVGLDIGSDESKGEIISLIKRRNSIGSTEKYSKQKYNPHIAGTAISAFYLSNPVSLWNKIKKAKTYREAIKIIYSLHYENPLDFVALTNLYKFVSVDRRNKSGGENRKFINKELECDLLIEETRIFSPDIIVFQSREFATSRYEALIKIIVRENPKIRVVLAPHPSNRTHRKPNGYIKQFHQYHN